MVEVVLNSKSGSHQANGVFDGTSVTVKKGSKIVVADRSTSIIVTARWFG